MKRNFIFLQIQLEQNGRIKEQKWSKEETKSKERQIDNNQQKCGHLLHAFCQQFAVYKMVNGLEDKSFAKFCKCKNLKEKRVFII